MLGLTARPGQPELRVTLEKTLGRATFFKMSRGSDDSKGTRASELQALRSARAHPARSQSPSCTSPALPRCADIRSCTGS